MKKYLLKLIALHVLYLFTNISFGIQHTQNNLHKNALIEYTKREYTPGIRFLLSNQSYKQRLDEKDQHGDTALMLSIMYYYIKGIELLINAGANINISNNDGNTPLILSIIYDYPEGFIKYLIESGADINAANNDKITPLTAAVLNENTQITKLLLESGASVNSLDKNGYSPLSFALAYKNHDLIEILIKNNANCLEFYIYYKVDPEWLKNYLPELKSLFLDTLKNQIIELGKLVANKSNNLKEANNNIQSINFNLLVDKSIASSIVVSLANKLSSGNIKDLAVLSMITGNIAILSIIEISELTKQEVPILKNFCHYILDPSDNPIIKAIDCQCFESAKVLIDKKIYSESKDNSGKSPISVAILSQRIDLVIALLSQKINLRNSGDNEIHNLLLYPILTNNIDILNLLINANQINNQLQDPILLIVAIKMASSDIVKLLLKHGAPVSTMLLDTEDTLLTLAIQEEKWDNALILLNHNIITSLKNKFGKTALNYLQEKKIKYKNDQKISRKIQDIFTLLKKKTLTESLMIKQGKIRVKPRR